MSEIKELASSETTLHTQSIPDSHSQSPTQPVYSLSTNSQRSDTTTTTYCINSPVTAFTIDDLKLILKPQQTSLEQPAALGKSPVISDNLQATSSDKQRLDSSIPNWTLDFASDSAQDSDNRKLAHRSQTAIKYPQLFPSPSHPEPHPLGPSISPHIDPFKVLVTPTTHSHTSPFQPRQINAIIENVKTTVVTHPTPRATIKISSKTADKPSTNQTNQPKAGLTSSVNTTQTGKEKPPSNTLPTDTQKPKQATTSLGREQTTLKRLIDPTNKPKFNLPTPEILETFEDTEEFSLPLSLPLPTSTRAQILPSQTQPLVKKLTRSETAVTQPVQHTIPQTTVVQIERPLLTTVVTSQATSATVPALPYSSAVQQQAHTFTTETVPIETVPTETIPTVQYTRAVIHTTPDTPTHQITLVPTQAPITQPSTSISTLQPSLITITQAPPRN